MAPGHPSSARYYGRAGSMSTRILRHFPWRNRSTLSALRVMWPSRIAVQMSVACRPRAAWSTLHSPSRQRAVNRALEAQLKRQGVRFSVGQPIALPIAPS